MNIKLCFNFLLLFVLFFFHIHAIKKNVVVEKKQKAGGNAIGLLDAFIKLCILYFCFVLQWPVFFLYILLYISYYITYYGSCHASKVYFYFWVNINFIIFVALHLICLSGASLITGDSLKDAFQNREIWLFVITLTLILLDFVGFLCTHYSFYEKIKILSSDTERFRQLVRFEYYAVLYLLFDSIPCVFQLPYRIVSLFLIGSCILLLLQVLLFFIHTYKIIEKAHYEAEYYRLEEERAAHVKNEMKLQKLAYHDSLTGTFTRRYAMEILESMQRDRKGVTVSYIDINGLKKVNDTQGHPAGDKYLILVANYLNKGLHKNDVLARIGGDEFLIVSPGSKKEHLEMALNKVNLELSEEKIGAFTPSFSFGVAEAGAAFDVDELLKQSDSFMYSYKIEYKRRNP